MELPGVPNGGASTSSTAFYKTEPMDTGSLASQLETILRELEARMPRPGEAAPPPAPREEPGGWGELLRYIAWVNRQLQPTPGRSGSTHLTSPGGAGLSSPSGDDSSAPGAGGPIGRGSHGFASAEGRRRKSQELRLRAEHFTRRLPPHAYTSQGFQLLELVRLTGSAHDGIEIHQSLHTLVRDLDSRHCRLEPVHPQEKLLLTLLRELAILTWVQARQEGAVT